MRKSLQSAIVALSLLFMVFGGITSTAVLGIDFGSEYYKISIISRTKTFQMIENINSKTNTYNALAFHDNTRFFEYEAWQKSLRNPRNTFYLFNKFVGRDAASDKLVNDLVELHQEDFKTHQIDGETFYELNNWVLPATEGQTKLIDRLQGKTLLRLEEIIGMILEHARQLCDKFAGEEAQDAYFSVPPWWTPVERKTVQAAAKLGGFNVIGMASENTGTAVYHATNRPKNGKEETILFINIGTQSTKLSIFKFEDKVDDKKKTRETFTLLGESWEQTLGGYALDACLADDFSTEFDEKFKLESIKKNKRVMRRLIRESTKLKEVLSANKEASLIVEEVFDYKDFSKKYLREDFETKCAHIFEKLNKAIDEVLERSGIKPEDINEIETLGGASRIPKFHSIIKEKLGKAHSIHFNGDNSMAQGLSFLGANVSNLIKTRPVYITHGPSYEINIDVEDPKTSGDNKYKKSSIIFKKYSSYGSKKVVNLNYQDDVDITLSVVPQSDQYDLKTPYSLKYKITGIKTGLNKLSDSQYSNQRVSFHFELSHLGIPSLLKGEVAADEKDEKTKSIKTSFEKLNIELAEESFKSLDQFEDKFKESKKVLEAFQNYDELIMKNKEAKNKLEAIIYKMSYLEDEENIKKFSSPEEIQKVKDIAKDMEDWLFSPEGRQANWETLQEKSTPFNKFFEKNQYRRDESLNRPDGLRIAHEKFDSVERTIRDLSDNRPWVPKKEREAGIKKIDSIRNWVQENAQKQLEMKTFVDPIITGAILKDKMAEAVQELARLKAIPKDGSAKEEPKKKEAEEPKKEAKEEAPKHDKIRGLLKVD